MTLSLTVSRLTHVGWSDSIPEEGHRVLSIVKTNIPKDGAANKS